MTQYQIEKRGKRYVVQVRNSVIGVGIWWADVQWFLSKKAAQQFIKDNSGVA